MKQYTDLGRKILENGSDNMDRTGVGTRSLFGEQLRFDLREGLPAVTTKKVNFRPLIRELLWFLRGETNVKTLDSTIWDAWCDSDGELGPVYGAQWRSAGGVRVFDRTIGEHWWHGGVDQIKNALELIKNNPTSRRIIVDSWNVNAIHKMALPPCHCLFQFNVDNEYLDLQLYQRSADYAIGVPFNITSYAILLSMFANECGLIPRHFIHTFGNVHLYHNHIEAFTEQLERPTHPLPKLELPKGKAVLDIVEEDIKIFGYKSERFIKYPIAV
jgi:thymidylate synthase